MSDWRKRAACKGRDDIDWFPARGEDATAAKAVCATCPVRGACLDEALENAEVGVWGGTSGRQRRGALVQRKPRPDGRNVQPCGTHAAFVRHKARGQEPCEPCKAAERAYQRWWWSQRQAKKKAS